MTKLIINHVYRLQSLERNHQTLKKRFDDFFTITCVSYMRLQGSIKNMPAVVVTEAYTNSFRVSLVS